MQLWTRSTPSSKHTDPAVIVKSAGTRIALIAGLVALVLSACALRGGGPGTITVGGVLPLSGEFASLGRSARDGMQMAVDIQNERGGITLNGTAVRVVLRIEDDRGEAVAGETAARRLVEGKVVALVAALQSDVAVAAARMAQQGGIPMITPAVTDPRVTAIGPFIFRACFDDRLAGRAMAYYARRALGARRAAVLTDRQAPYNITLAGAFAAAFADLGGRVVAQETFADEAQAADFAPMLVRIRAGHPDVLFAPNYYRATAEIATQARALGLKVPVLSAEGVNSPDFPVIGGDAVEGAAFPAHFAADDPRPRAREFRDRYVKTYGRDPDAFAALAYDAAGLVLDGIRRAGSDDPRAVRDALAQTRDFEGATGMLTFEGGQDPRKEVIILRVQGGRFVFYTTVKP